MCLSYRSQKCFFVTALTAMLAFDFQSMTIQQCSNCSTNPHCMWMAQRDLAEELCPRPPKLCWIKQKPKWNVSFDATTRFSFITAAVSDDGDIYMMFFFLCYLLYDVVFCVALIFAQTTHLPINPSYFLPSRKSLRLHRLYQWYSKNNMKIEWIGCRIWEKNATNFWWHRSKRSCYDKIFRSFAMTRPTLSFPKFTQACEKLWIHCEIN